MFTVLLNVSIAFADTINIYCPYCDNIGVEVLNDKDGVCKCFNCDRNMLILNGTIYTDDKRELPLFAYVVYPEKKENALDDNDNEKIDTSNKTNASKNSDDKSSDNMNSIVEPEIDVRTADNKIYELEAEEDVISVTKEVATSKQYYDQSDETADKKMFSEVLALETPVVKRETIEDIIVNSLDNGKEAIDGQNNYTSTYSEINIPTKSIIINETSKYIDEPKQDKMEDAVNSDASYIIVALMVLIMLTVATIIRKSVKK